MIEKQYPLDGRSIDPPVEVECIHCGARYMSNEGKFETRFGMDIPLFWCKDENCDGAGVNFDLLVVMDEEE